MELIFSTGCNISCHNISKHLSKASTYAEIDISHRILNSMSCFGQCISEFHFFMTCLLKFNHLGRHLYIKIWGVVISKEPQQASIALDSMIVKFSNRIAIVFN